MITNLLRTIVPLLLAVAVATSVGGQTAAPATADSHMRRAQQLLAEKKPELAIPELRAVVRLDPNNIDAQANLGVLLYFSGSYAEAVPALHSAVEARPGLGKIQALLGLSEQRTGNLQAAARDLAAALPLVTDKGIHVETGLALVEVEQALGQLDKAAAVVSDLRATDATDPQVLAAAYQVYQQGMSEALLTLAVADPASAQLPFIMGERLVAQGEADQAIANFRKALAIDQNLPGLHYELATALSSSSDPSQQEEAVSEFKAALRVNPFDEKAWLGLANREEEKGTAEQAAADYGRALALAPDDAEADTGLAKVMVARGDKVKAVALLEHAVALDPTDITAHYRLSTLYRQQGKDAEAKQQLALYEHYKSVHGQLETAVKAMREPSSASAEGDSVGHR